MPRPKLAKTIAQEHADKATDLLEHSQSSAQLVAAQTHATLAVYHQLRHNENEPH